MDSTCQTYQQVLDRTTREALAQMWTVLNAPVVFNPALVYARLADLARSSALLWTEAGLEVQERTVRDIGAGRAVSRSLVLATVATDIALGYFTLYERARWFPLVVEQRDWQWQNERGARRVMETAATLGGALIKACQFASTRPDLLPASYIRALTPLQDSMPSRPWPEIEQTIRSELGRPLEEVFAQIEQAPVAAASISQVHRAQLRDGRQVALKVQYQDVRDLVATDLAVLQRLVRLVAQVAPSVQLQPILDYLQATLPLELDFVHEAEAMTQLRTALQHRTDVLVPAVVPELSTERLIVMEYVDGIKITDREALQRAGVDLHATAELLNDAYADQMLRCGMLHADPHPGNLLVQPGRSGPRLALLDHGLTVPLGPALVESLRRMVRALASGDFTALTQVLSDAGVQLDKEVDLASLLGLIGVLLGNAQAEEPEEGQQEAAQQAPSGGIAVGVRLSKSIGSIPVDLLLVGRALGLLDGITKQLDPSVDALQIVAHYI